MTCEKYLKPMSVSPAFSEETIDTIFLNLPEILEFQTGFHLKLVQALEEEDSATVEEVFTAEAAEFMIYKTFCSRFDAAVDCLVETLNGQEARRVVQQCQLTSKTDLSLQAYLLSVVQRICKYPLLFAELRKNTQAAEDVARCDAALTAMRGVADAVNEDKRRMEDLQAIDSWQQSVTGWSGPNLRDTSSRSLHHGTVSERRP